MGDFGGIVFREPRQTVRPASASEVAAAVRSSMAERPADVVPRGCGHSSRGESTTDGIAIDMRGMTDVHRLGDDYITVDTGATWRDVLETTLRYGRMPPVLTDYLDLTVGGTLSAAGIGGTSHIHGTQAANVTELEVVTPDAKILTCSPSQHRDVFDAVRAGMGRHGVMTRATIRLVPAPKRVLVCRARFASIAELIIEQGRIRADDVSGQIKPSGFELKAVLYDASAPPRKLALVDVEQLEFIDFADRMRPDVANLVELGEWGQPHPWGQVIMPAAQAATVIDTTLSRTTPADLGLSGVVLIKRFRPGPVPMLRAPGDVVLFGLLRTASPGCRTVTQMAAANHRLYERAQAVGGVPYPPRPGSNLTPAT